MRTPDPATKVTIAATDHKTDVELVVDRPGGAIRGTVTGPDGKPLADAWVSVHQDLSDLVARMEQPGAPDGGGESRMITVRDNDDGGSAGSIPPALTDAAGHFEIGGLPRTPWSVVAEASAGKLRGRVLHVTPDATITIQILSVTELHGTVHAAGALGVFSVELEGPTHAQRSFASPDGTFSFGRVDPGPYTVHVTSSAGNGDAPVQVVSGQPANVDVALASNAIVIGKLVDGAGKPVGGVAVATVPDSGDGHLRISLEGPPLTSDPDGRFRIAAKAGKVVLVVLVQPHPVAHPGLVLEAGKTFDAGTITVEVAPPPKP